MAVAFDAVTAATATATGGTLTVAHTCSGSDRVLVVTLAYSQLLSVTGVTYDGVSMTNEGTIRTGVSNDGNRKQTLLTLIGPASGSNNVVFTVSGAAELQYGIQSFTGGNAVQNFGTAQGSTSPITQAVSSATNNIVVDGVTNDNSGADSGLTVGASQTQRFNLDTGKTGGSTEPGAASVTMSWTMTNSYKWASTAIDLVSGTQPIPATGNFFLVF